MTRRSNHVSISPYYACFEPIFHFISVLFSVVQQKLKNNQTKGNIRIEWVGKIEYKISALLSSYISTLCMYSQFHIFLKLLSKTHTHTHTRTHTKSGPHCGISTFWNGKNNRFKFTFFFFCAWGCLSFPRILDTKMLQPNCDNESFILQRWILSLGRTYIKWCNHLREYFY